MIGELVPNRSPATGRIVTRSLRCQCREGSFEDALRSLYWAASIDTHWESSIETASIKTPASRPQHRDSLRCEYRDASRSIESIVIVSLPIGSICRSAYRTRVTFCLSVDTIETATTDSCKMDTLGTLFTLFFRYKFSFQHVGLSWLSGHLGGLLTD